MGARRLISGTGSKRFTGARGVKNVGKRTRSGPMKTVRPGKRRSDSLEVSSRQIEKISLSHDAKQVRYTCNIRRYLSHEVKQARYGSDGVRLFANMYLHPVRNSLLCCIFTKSLANWLPVSLVVHGLRPSDSVWVYWTTLAWWFLSRPIWWHAIISLLINV